MKRIPTAAVVLFAFSISFPALAASGKRSYEAAGEVTSIDPALGRVTIQHGAIKGFSASDETEFRVESGAFLKDVAKGDLVVFTIADEKGDVRIEKIAVTGRAPEKEEGLPIGKAVQGVIVGTGEIAKAVTSPIQPVHEVVSGTTEATTSATGSVLEDANGPEVKQKF